MRDWTKKYQPELITTICIEVRQALLGAADPWPVEEFVGCYNWLWNRLAKWEDNPRTRDFDLHVKGMVGITLMELKRIPYLMRERTENEELAKLSVGT